MNELTEMTETYYQIQIRVPGSREWLEGPKHEYFYRAWKEMEARRANSEGMDHRAVAVEMKTTVLHAVHDDEDSPPAPLLSKELP